MRNLHLFLTGTSASQKKVEISQTFFGLLRIYELYSQILAVQLTLSLLEGEDYAHQITAGTPRFSDLPLALLHKYLLTRLNSLALSAKSCLNTPCAVIDGKGDS